MESSLIYITILLLSMFEFSSGIVYNRGKYQFHFTCYNEGTTTNIRIIKLFLSHDNLKIHCFFQSDSEEDSKAVLGAFTTGGTAPSILIMNSTYNSVFHFNLSLFNNRLLWKIDIPRENITVNTDIAAVEEWVIRLTMHEKVNIYNTEGTLLDLVREPILQWRLGPILSKTKLMLLLPYVIDIKVTKCPCANDVALLAFVFNSTHSGVYIGKTIYGFWRDSETEWYDLTQAVYAELKDDHKGLTVIDMVITNHFLVILTSLGLFVSPDLRYPTTSYIQLSRAPFCGFERVDYIKGKLWYSEKCFANRESFEVDYVTITFDRNRTLSESSSCFYSKEPFREWLPCLSASYRSTRFLPHVVSFLIDQETYSGIYFFHHQGSKRTSVSVSMLKNGKPNPQTKFPAFKFPSSFNRPVGMVFHPRSHFLYVYGNEAWISSDGGNSFDLLSNFHTDIILRTAHSFYTSHISFISQIGNIYNTKAGLKRYTRLGKIHDKIFTLYYDQMGYIHKLTPDRFNTDTSHPDYGTLKSFFGAGSTTVSVVVWDASAECFVTTLVPTLKSSCSYLRTLHHVPGRYIPPAAWISGVQKDSRGFNMIKTLPVNYRPPSNMGISIPLTDNFYHADPSKPIPRNLFYKSKETGKYKQCANATSREMCNCTEHQKFSHAVAFSDCKEKVHRFRFPVTRYPVVLEIYNEQKQKFPVKPPYLVTVTEVNMRKNWELKHAEPESVKKMKNYLEPLLKTPVYNPFGLNLSIKGSELFHFKVSMVPGLSFCNLEEEFQIYVDEVPLPFPGHALIAIATSVVLGGLIFVSFLFQMHNIHPLRAFQRHRRRHTTNPSDTSVNS
ncbi:cation channel sperm-associated auxiliary subunit beta [Acomys russatus]|uniref:cation channel sperm-associated auxiliary subunit beta n=1 Tax=Acomys russatus TaxID=60746 RepID=UPI0021E1C43A|nr:cation channel sperm-associated auxiliary subunit beta [Acomys russatus]